MQFVVDIALFILYLSLFFLFCAWMCRFWVMYIRQKHLQSIDWLLLEVKLPREINKSPYAAELAIASLLQTGGIGNKYAIWYKGNLPVYASLEIASLEGVVHFYIRIQRKFRALVEANFYAQYPGVELVEADDYTKAIRYHHLTKDVSCWGAEYRLTKKWKPTNEKTGQAFKEIKEGKEVDFEMPADFLPLKTYVDYGLDKDPKEEYKIDPLAQMIEAIGSLGKGEYFWYQVILSDEGNYNGSKFLKFYVNALHEHISLSDMAKERKKQIRTSGWTQKGKKIINEYGVPLIIDSYDEEYNQQYKEEEKDGKTIKVPLKKIATFTETKAIAKKEMELTQEEKDELEVINKKLSKSIALGIIRAVYVAKKEKFNAGHIQTILSLPKPFANPLGNSLAPTKVTEPYNFPWENWLGRRVPWRTEEMFEAYVEREGFFPHAEERKTLDKWEDTFFWTSSMKQRKIFRMIYESLFYPFDHPHPDANAYNLEEIATLWHLPGQTVNTPTLPRIDSTKGVAPVNLPV